MGCVGDDFEKQNLIQLAQSAGLDVKYQTHPKLTTGRCAVLISSRDQVRTMVASLGASEAFTADFLDERDNWGVIEQAQIFCSESSNLHAVLEAIRDTPKWNRGRPRIVVVTKIPERTTVATVDGIKEYRWKKPSKVIDTHGCGDALAGGMKRFQFFSF
ncbi:unnamed protein product [Rotaria sp. Silwood2]|nr:unnamed protein product [Rotaria sp. Silwood2]CAF3015176.1 unnamed protein product [Rotaria sp. Silwood2]CAF3278790.1 unnamed protein product [Rotaria sp. Silwood2]